MKSRGFLGEPPKKKNVVRGEVGSISDPKTEPFVFSSCQLPLTKGFPMLERPPVSPCHGSAGLVQSRDGLDNRHKYFDHAWGAVGIALLLVGGILCGSGPRVRCIHAQPSLQAATLWSVWAVAGKDFIQM